MREYIRIFWKDRLLFAVLVILFVFFGALWQGLQPVRYQAALLLNVGRQSVQETQDYTFDSFYRLQADERFGDTVVRWLQSPRVVTDIFQDAGESAPGNSTDFFQARRLSSQVIEVTFVSGDEETLRSLSHAAVKVLNRYAADLNRENSEANWFVVIGSEPILSDARVPFLPVLLISFFIGFFVAFWTILLKHYLIAKE